MAGSAPRPSRLTAMMNATAAAAARARCSAARARPAAECGTGRPAPKRTSSPSAVSFTCCGSTASPANCVATGFSTKPPLTRTTASAARASPAEASAAAASSRSGPGDPARARWRQVTAARAPHAMTIGATPVITIRPSATWPQASSRATIAAPAQGARRAGRCSAASQAASTGTALPR